MAGWSHNNRVDAFEPEWYSEWKDTAEAAKEVGKEITYRSLSDGIEAVTPLATELIFNTVLSPQTFSTIVTNSNALTWGGTLGSLGYMAGTMYGGATAEKAEEKKIRDIK